MRRQPFEMNRLERAYADRLDRLVDAGTVVAWWFQPFALRLVTYNKLCKYEIDFLVQLHDGTLRVDEVKGHMEEDAWLKLKIAAGIYPFRFYLWRRKDGDWSYLEVNPADQDQQQPGGSGALFNGNDQRA